jgi:hypothetical protein
MLARQSTALTVIVGPILDSTGAEYASAVIGDLSISKNGGTLTAMASAATLTYIDNGMYTLVTTTGNMDTLGAVQVTCNKATYQMPKMERNVVPASVYDAIIANATNTTGGLPAATGTISALAGAVSTLTAGGVRTELATELSSVVAIKDKTDLIVTFPANFSNLDITIGGGIAQLGPNALAQNDLYTPIAQANWNALTTATWATNSFGKQILIGASTQRTVAVTGSHHVAAVLHDAEPNSIPEDAFVDGALSARVIATDAIDSDAMAASANTEIANAVAATQALSRLDSMIESDGAGQFRFDTIALEMAPAGGGGGGTDWTANERTAIRAILGVPTSGTTPTDPTTGILDTIRDSLPGNQTINVYPVSASTPERVAGTTITYYRNEIRSVSVVTDFTLTNLTLSFTIEDAEGTDLLTIPNGSITRSNQTFTVSIGTDVTASVGNKRWALRDITGGTNSVIARGVFSVQEAASA